MSFIFKKIELFSKKEVVDLIAGNITVLDEHLELIATSLGTRTGQWCDLMGRSNDGQLVLISVEERYTDKMFLSILSRLDAVWENMCNISRLYPTYEIEQNHLPRVVILAPSYPSSFIKSLGYLTYRMRIDLFTYRCLESEEGRGLLVEPVETNIIFFDIADLNIKASEFRKPLFAKGVRISTIGKTRIRAVTHLDVSHEQILQAIDIFNDVVKEIKRNK